MDSTSRPLEVVLLDESQYLKMNVFEEKFSRALAVVTPHGAQAPNAIFTCKDTVVIEFLCIDDIPGKSPHLASLYCFGEVFFTIYTDTLRMTRITCLYMLLYSYTTS